MVCVGTMVDLTLRTCLTPGQSERTRREEKRRIKVVLMYSARAHGTSHDGTFPAVDRLGARGACCYTWACPRGSDSSDESSNG